MLTGFPNKRIRAKHRHACELGTNTHRRKVPAAREGIVFLNVKLPFMTAGMLGYLIPVVSIKAVVLRWRLSLVVVGDKRVKGDPC